MAPLRAPRDPNRIVWRWHHVIALALLAWGLPVAALWWLDIDRSIVGLLNRALAIQIVAYLVAGFALALLVWKRQHGDWSTLGLGDDVRRGRMDVLRGAAFGLAVFLGYLPVGLFAKGRASLDPMISLLLGNSNGAGLVLTCAVVVIGAPVVEEIFFRGVLYEKIARRWPQIAILVTSVLFMLVHGAIILQILVLGLLFGIKRSKGESTWYTIGAHAAWNASVVVIGIIFLTSSAVAFTSSAGLYELRYEREWQREESFEASMPTGHIELALLSANGSMISVVEFTDVATLDRLGTSRVVKNLPTSMNGATGPITNLSVSRRSFPGASEAYDVTATVPIMGVSLDYQIVAARPQGEGRIVIFMVACPDVSCEQAQQDFDEMMDTVTFL
jgi:membrane protease YdiL (CAAX protease family)